MLAVVPLIVVRFGSIKGEQTAECFVGNSDPGHYFPQITEVSLHSSNLKK